MSRFLDLGEDGDTPTPKHDAIVEWLNVNAAAVIKDLEDTGTSREQHWASEIERIGIPGNPPSYDDDIWLACEWERPLIQEAPSDRGKKYGSDRTVGYIDLATDYRIPLIGYNPGAHRKCKLAVCNFRTPDADDCRHDGNHSCKGHSQCPGDNDLFLDDDIEFYENTGFPDIRNTLDKNCPGHWLREPSWQGTKRGEIRHLYFEVKPDIPSCGALIRQLRRYQSVADVPYMVVSPDVRWRDRIKDQGFYFLDPHQPSRLWEPMPRS